MQLVPARNLDCTPKTHMFVYIWSTNGTNDLITSIASSPNPQEHFQPEIEGGGVGGDIFSTPQENSSGTSQKLEKSGSLLMIHRMMETILPTIMA